MDGVTLDGVTGGRTGQEIAPGPTVMGVDFGTTHTVSALAGPDGRVQPVLFDASFLLPSAVFAEVGGTFLVGRDAERSARLDPARYEPNPKRRIDDGTVLLGANAHPVETLIAAVLRRVGGEATRVAGVLPARTVLTHPAGWGAARRAVLTGAAAQAGMRGITLVPEPVAAATYFTTVLAQQVAPGGLLVVYDLGGGTFDTSVLRSRPGGGWDVVAAAGLDDVGGLDLDQAIVAHLQRTLGSRDGQRWSELVVPRDDAGRRRLRAFWEDARAVKEQLSRTSSASIHVPLFDTDTLVTREEFERAVHPLLVRTVDLTARTLQQAGGRADQVAGLFLVGGSSRIPLVSTLLHQRLGVAPTVIEQPEVVVTLGSLYAARAADTPAPTPAPPPDSTAVVATGGAEPPPARDALRRPPARGARAASPPGARAARRALNRRPMAVLVAIVLLLAVGVGARQIWKATNDEPGGGGTGMSNNPGGGGDPTGAGGNTAPAATGDANRVILDKSVWYRGVKATFGTLTYDPGTKMLTGNVRLENQASYRFAVGDFAVHFHSGGQFYPGRVVEDNPVPASSAAEYHVEFKIDRVADGLRAGAIVVGHGSEAQPVVQLDGGAGIPNEPRSVFANRKVTHRDLALTFTACELRADLVKPQRQADKGHYVFGCFFDVQRVGEGTHRDIGPSSVRLRLPDGTTISPAEVPRAFLSSDQVTTGVYFGFTFPWPVPGTYVLQIIDLHSDEKPSAQNTLELPFTV